MKKITKTGTKTQRNAREIKNRSLEYTELKKYKVEFQELDVFNS
ncbi:hypothetical protein [Nitrosopumilus maritimus]|nr:hypothetical protein [Nitrosopumilus maritimus]